MSTEGLDLDTVEQTWQRALDGEIGWSYVLQDVPALLAELRAQRATVAALTAERDEAIREMHAFNRDADEMEVELNAARAVLAPLLERPYRSDPTRPGPNDLSLCKFCGYHRNPYTGHFDDCPVLRRDALLGRAREEGQG